MSVPFWSGRKKSDDDDVLLNEYAVDPDALPARSEGKTKTTFASARSAQTRNEFTNRRTHALPAAVVRTNRRVENDFNNRHIKDKRLGAQSRAEFLRQQILRGTQDSTVVRGSPAFRDRNADGYNELDKLQPEGGGGQPKRKPPAETDSEDSDGSSSSGGGVAERHAAVDSRRRSIEDDAKRAAIKKPVAFVPATDTAIPPPRETSHRRHPGLASGTGRRNKFPKKYTDSDDEKNSPAREKTTLLDEISQLSEKGSRSAASKSSLTSLAHDERAEEESGKVKAKGRSENDPVSHRSGPPVAGNWRLHKKRRVEDDEIVVDYF